jgi:hypothetical protein
MKRRTYPGVLGRRSFPSEELDVAEALHPNTEAGAAAEAGNRVVILEHQQKGLELLLEHFKISNDLPPALQYALLACALAYRHVPYFQIPGKRRGPRPNETRFALLEVDMVIEQRAGAASERKALQQLCESKPPWNKSDFDSLARQLRAARTSDAFARGVRNLIAAFNANSQLTDRMLDAMRSGLNDE